MIHPLAALKEKLKPTALESFDRSRYQNQLTAYLCEGEPDEWAFKGAKSAERYGRFVVVTNEVGFKDVCAFDSIGEASKAVDEWER